MRMNNYLKIFPYIIECVAVISISQDILKPSLQHKNRPNPIMTVVPSVGLLRSR